MFYVYRIYFNNQIQYVGRTTDMQRRMRQHMTGKYNRVKNSSNTIFIDPNLVSKIEYAELQSESDMNLYELYYILKCKPPMNTKDFAKDELSIELDELQFKQYFPYGFEDWQEQSRKDCLRINESNMIKQMQKDILHK